MKRVCVSDPFVRVCMCVCVRVRACAGVKERERKRGSCQLLECRNVVSLIRPTSAGPPLGFVFLM